MYKSIIAKYFGAAHICENSTEAKEKNLHGHNFSVLITMEDEQFINGEIFNFAKLKELCKFINDIYDHVVLINIHNTNVINFCENNEFPFKTFNDDPTIENIAKEIFNTLKLMGTPIYSVAVSENDYTFTVIK
jgi:6-pyruvoyl-tetrahydropterin synthase